MIGKRGRRAARERALGREAAGGLVEPRPDRRPPGSRSRLSGEEQEGGLEYVLGGVRVSDYSPGSPLDHSAVPTDHLGERRFVVYSGEGVQQLGVGCDVVARVRQRRLEGGSQWKGRHPAVQRPQQDQVQREAQQTRQRGRPRSRTSPPRYASIVAVSNQSWMTTRTSTMQRTP